MFDKLKKDYVDKVNVKRLDLMMTPFRLLIALAGIFALSGFAIALFPKFFAVVFGLFFVFFGGIFALLAWKAYKFKNRIEKVYKKFQPGAVVVQQMRTPSSEVSIEEREVLENIELDLKKITWH